MKDSLREVIANTPLSDLALAGFIWLVSTFAGPLILVGLFQLCYSAAKAINGLARRACPQ